MKNTALLSELTNSVLNVMENMFSFSIEKSAASGENMLEISSPAQFKACQIRFSGHLNGYMFLCMSPEVLKTLAWKFTGSDPETVTDEFATGTLKEVLNIVAGNALTLLDKSSYIKLGIPEMTEVSDLSRLGHVTVFDTQQGMIAAGLDLNQGK